MKTFKYILISSISIFTLHFLAHFIFNIFQNDLIGVFFPTNESIFQHMKMVFTCFFGFYFLLFIIRRKFNFENIFLTNLVASVCCISFFLVIYLPVYLNLGESMIFTFILLFISIMFGQFVSYSFLLKDEYKQVEWFSLILLAIIFIINGYLTYHPIENFIFYDFKHQTYKKVLA